MRPHSPHITMKPPTHTTVTMKLLVLACCVAATLTQADIRSSHTRQVTLTGRKYHISSRQATPAQTRSQSQDSRRGSPAQSQNNYRGSQSQSRDYRSQHGQSQYNSGQTSQAQYNRGSPSQWAKISASRGGQVTSRGSKGTHNLRMSSQRSRLHPSRRQRPRTSKPNIVVIMTDDQDVLLGSLKVMPKLRRVLTQQGVYFNNSFVSTPMCCPSRSSFLTGLYVHNHNVLTNNANCSSQQWRDKYESRSFATYINESYATGYFGKYLNEYDGKHTPPGWHRWVGLIRNSHFYNYSVADERGVITEHYDNYYKDYLTDLVANDSVAFLQDSKRNNPHKPIMMMLSVPAPHGPEDAAPQYQHMFENNTDHRTPTWNMAPNEDKQWMLQHTYPMTPQYKKFTDLLQRRRLQTLQSVDDLVEKVVDELDLLGELSNTYILFTSDHGYHLGQYGVIKGKGLSFDTDVRVPLIMRGPGIRPGSVISNMVHNIDIAPTIIDLAGGKVPSHMDGQSVLRLIKASKDSSNVDENGFVSLKRPWRDTVLLERGKVSEKVLKERLRTEEINYYASGTKQGNYFFGSERMRKLYKECAKGDNRLPCKPNQRWYCVEDSGRLRKHKCRGTNQLQKDQPPALKPCPCPSRARYRTRLARKERRQQRRALRQAQRLRRAQRKKRAITDLPHMSGRILPATDGFEPRMDVRCRILSNSTVHCDQDIYHKPLELEHYKETVEEMIREYKKALADLKDIKQHLVAQQNRGDSSLTSPHECLCDDRGNVVEGMDRPSKKPITKEEREKKKKQSRRKRKKKDCNIPNMNCFTHDNGHWVTPPYWNYGPFCFCANSNKGTYWCLRSINQTHDFLYCEFITLFMSYYDLKTDPFQARNVVTEINYGVLQQLHEDLDRLKGCSGPTQCNVKANINGRRSSRRESGEDWEGLTHLRRSQSRSRRKYYDDLAEDSMNFDQGDVKGYRQAHG